MYANRFFSLLVVVALASIAALTIQEAVSTKALFFDSQSREVERKRSLDADRARWTAMGEYYMNLEAEKSDASEVEMLKPSAGWDLQTIIRT